MALGAWSLFCLLGVLVCVTAQTFLGPMPAHNYAFQATQSSGNTQTTGGVAVDASGNQFYALTSSATSVSWNGASAVGATAFRAMLFKMSPQGLLRPSSTVPLVQPALMPDLNVFALAAGVGLGTAATIGASPNETPLDVAVSQQTGTVYLAGYFQVSQMNFAGISLTNGAAVPNAFLYSFNNTLGAQWAWVVRAGANNVQGTGVAVDDGTNSVFLSGWYDSTSITAYSHTGSGPAFTCGSNGQTDVFVVRVDATFGSFLNHYCGGTSPAFILDCRRFTSFELDFRRCQSRALLWPRRRCVRFCVPCWCGLTRRVPPPLPGSDFFFSCRFSVILYRELGQWRHVNADGWRPRNADSQAKPDADSGRLLLLSITALPFIADSDVPSRRSSGARCGHSW
jgi:hypothetical protein